MKALKKLLILGALCVSCLSMGIFTACNNNRNSNSSNSDVSSSVDSSASDGTDSSDSSSSGEDEQDKYVYKIRTQSIGGYGLRNVHVSLFNGEELITDGYTNGYGDIYFTESDVPTLGEYDIVFDDIPAGWSYDDSIIYRTDKVSGSALTVNFEASLITNATTPATKLYRLGDVMYDFSVKTCDGKTFILSEELKEKDMVLLNFWASWCGPCQREFPAMKEAYLEYSSKVSILAASIETVKPADSQNGVAEFKANQGFTFDMVGHPNASAVVSRFDTASVPVSVVIDRYGVVSYIHSGSIESREDFAELFDMFIGDSYVQTVLESFGEDEENGGDGEADRKKPTVSAPSIDSITPVVTSDPAFSFAWDTEDEYAWPWTVETLSDNSKSLVVSNKNIHNSYATLKSSFVAPADKVLTFDAYIDTEDTDQLYVLIDDVLIHRYSGSAENPAWATKYAYVFDQGDEGAHTLTLIYMKDANTNVGEDIVKIKNLRFEDVSVLDSPTIDLDIFQNAASGFNKPPETIEDGVTKVPKFQNYVNVALGEDGFYHVIPEEGTPVDIDKHPILFANIMSSSLWNAYTVWQVAYLGYATYDGHSLESLIEQFAWACGHSDNNYVPVTKELQQILDLMVRQEVAGEFYDKQHRTTTYFDPKYHISYHDKEWLELCVYYKHYGQTAQMGDPTLGITYDSAIPLKLNDVNHIVCNKSIVPLGIKHKIQITKAGVYRFQSIVDQEVFDSNAFVDPQCWIVAEDRTTELAYCDDTLLHPTNNPDNFEIYLYLEEGTYYCLFAMFMNETGEFDMRIDFMDDTRYDYFTNCAIGPYSFNPITNQTYVPGTQHYKYDETTDCYRITDENGVFLADIYAGLDDRVYVDLSNATYLFPYNSLASYVESADNYAIEKRLFYLKNADGTYTDYTPVMQKYLFFAYRNNDILYGKTTLNQELMNILSLLAKYYDGFDGVKDSWQMMCYYYNPIVKEVNA